MTEPDDGDDTQDVPLCVTACWWCGRDFVSPAADAERFCGDPCSLAWCEWSARTMPQPADLRVREFPW